MYYMSRTLIVEWIDQILETAFKKETVGLVTREQYVEKVLDYFTTNHLFWLLTTST